MIQVDYSGTALNAILSFSRELQGSDKEVVTLIRHVILSTLQSYRKKYSNEYGELVICCDNKNYWRKDYFPHYKAGRKKSREQSNLPWQLIFNTMSEMKDDIRSYFPYKVIEVEKAEADDVIAVLTEWLQENEMKQVGLIETVQPIMIISADHDFKQLHRFENVKQWSPITKKLVKAEKDYMTNGHIAHIVKAGDDGIPSILNPDDIFLQEGVRQKPVSAKRLEEFIQLGREACRTDEERRNWDRNKTLVDFSHIPDYIRTSVIDTYTNAKVVNDKNAIFNYLVKNRCRQLLDNIEEF